jgi:hypothetical protein
MVRPSVPPIRGRTMVADEATGTAGHQNPPGNVLVDRGPYQFRLAVPAPVPFPADVPG